MVLEEEVQVVCPGVVVVVGNQDCNSLLWMLPVEVQQTVYQSLTVFRLVCKDQELLQGFFFRFFRFSIGSRSLHVGCFCVNTDRR